MPATGTLSANEPIGAKVKEKAGPRHFRFTKDEKFVYLLNELDATIYVLPYDAKTGIAGQGIAGRSVRCRTASTASPGPPTSSSRRTAPGSMPPSAHRARWRGSRSTRATGKLTPVGTFPTEQQPRAFAIDPSGRYLYAVGEKSDSMTSYAIDAKTGKLEKLKQYPVGKNPNWVEIVDFR